MTVPYLDAEVSEMLGIIGNSGHEIRVFQGDVQEHAEKVRDMLGHYAHLEAAAAVWSEHTVERMRVAHELVEATQPSLAGNWSGDAYRAYQAYASTVLGRMADTEEQARRIAGEIGSVRDTIAGQYQAATTSLATIAAGVIGLAGGLGYLRPEVADEFRGLVGTFVTDVGECLGQVMTSLAASRDVVLSVREVVAGLRVLEPATVTAPAIGQPDAWRLESGTPDGRRPGRDGWTGLGA